MKDVMQRLRDAIEEMDKAIVDTCSAPWPAGRAVSTSRAVERDAKRERLIALAAVEAEITKLSAPWSCSVCGGTGKPVSGLPCICGGKGTEQAEIHGLRCRCFELEDEVERLQTELAGKERFD